MAKASFSYVYFNSLSVKVREAYATVDLCLFLLATECLL